MAEIGVVIEEKGRNVIVALERTEACGSCKACSVGIEKEQMILEARNSCEAKVGDYVSIAMEESRFIMAVAIMYIIPLAGLLLGTALGYLIWRTELMAIILGFLCLGLTYLGIRLSEKRIKNKNFKPVADKVIGRE